MSEVIMRIGIVDSGCHPAQASSVEAARGFMLDAAAHVITQAATPDQIGHGGAVLGHIARLAPDARLVIAQVFHQRARTSPAQIAAAIDWLIAQRVRLINLSLGFRADRASLRQACERAIQVGILICASSPARGEPVFPASYPGVIRVTGDARCQPHQWSWLNSPQADFGAAMSAAMPTDSQPNAPVGASMATAVMSGHIAAWLSAHPESDAAALRAYLHQQAAFIGIERRGAAP